MKVLIKEAKILIPSHPEHRKTKDILIDSGKIISIEDQINSGDALIIRYPGLHVSLGWVDCFAHFCDPGTENRETLESGALAAADGGFTDVMIIPNTLPTLSTKTQIEYIRKKSAPLPVSIHPIGSITKNAEGKELAEMYDMHNSGAVAFSDGYHPVQHAGVLIKAMQYVLANDRVIIQMPDDRSISKNGLMNEGIISTQLGLPGKPLLAETLMLQRDIQILNYTNSRLHITGISSQESIELIRHAKKSGLQITCSCTPYHLNFSDEDLVSYDTNLKLNPPLRTSVDRLALIEALNDGTIDCIATHHYPQHWDNKTCEFEYAGYGMIGLESAFGALHLHAQEIDLLIQQLTDRPRKIFNLPDVRFEEQADACLTLFIPDNEHVFTKEMLRSSSSNSAFIGKSLKGKVIGTIHNHQIMIQQL